MAVQENNDLDPEKVAAEMHAAVERVRRSFARKIEATEKDQDPAADQPEPDPARQMNR